MKKQLKQLEEFHKAFGLYMNEHPTLRIPQELHELRMRVMKEEVDEYAEEYAITGDSEDARLQAVAKELADIAYTLLGTVVSHGLQDEFERIFDAVHESNMSKLDENGKPIYRKDGFVKPRPIRTRLWLFSVPTSNSVVTATLPLLQKISCKGKYSNSR